MPQIIGKDIFIQAQEMMQKRKKHQDLIKL